MLLPLEAEKEEEEGQQRCSFEHSINPTDITGSQARAMVIVIKNDYMYNPIVGRTRQLSQRHAGYLLKADSRPELH